MDSTNSTRPALSIAALRLWRTAGREIRLETEGISMRPLIEPGDEIRVQLMDPDPLRIGDLIAFWDGAKIVVHRLVKIQRSEMGRRFCEKGDDLLDWNWIDEDRVLGKVVSIESRKGRLAMARWPWNWINPVVGGIQSVWIALFEKSQASRPPVSEESPVPGGCSRIGNRFLRGLLWIINKLNRALLSFFLVSTRLLGSGRSAKVW